MQIIKSSNYQIIKSYGTGILALLVIVTRIPFLFDGYGHEEDSYGLVVNAWEMWSNDGKYFASRFPGHPLQEYIYYFFWDSPAWVWNSFSCFFSVASVVAFYKALQKSGINYAFETSLMFAFTPVFYIAGTYSIDYAWSLAFILLSFWTLVNRKFWWCGVLLGMAIGCRITSGVFIIPWMILLYNRLDVRQWIIDTFKIGIPMILIGLAWYIPAYMTYGTGFFDYSDQFPYPPFTKIAYKASIGVFGLVGIIAITIALGSWLRRKEKTALHPPAIASPERITFLLIVIIVLQVISYLRLPQKSGYLVAIVPFVFMLVTMYSTKKIIRAMTVLMILSSFIFSINLTDSLRGAESSPLAARFIVSGQEIFIDPLSGPILSEQSKRRNKMKYVESVSEQMLRHSENQTVICGWWYNEILVNFIRQGRVNIEKTNAGKTEAWIEKNPGDTSQLKLYFYLDCSHVDYLRASETLPTGKIYYLPEQDLYNDQMFGQECTNEVTEVFPTR